MPGQLAAAEAAHKTCLAKVAAHQLAATARGDFARAQALQADIPRVLPYSVAVRTAMTTLQAQITSMQAQVTGRLTGALAALVAVCAVVAVIAAGGVAMTCGSRRVT